MTINILLGVVIGAVLGFLLTPTLSRSRQRAIMNTAVGLLGALACSLLANSLFARKPDAIPTSAFGVIAYSLLIGILGAGVLLFVYNAFRPSSN